VGSGNHTLQKDTRLAGLSFEGRWSIVASARCGQWSRVGRETALGHAPRVKGQSALSALQRPINQATSVARGPTTLGGRVLSSMLAILRRLRAVPTPHFLLYLYFLLSNSHHAETTAGHYILWYDGVNSARWNADTVARLSEDSEYKFIHRVKWRHRIYGQDTFAILWV